MQPPARKETKIELIDRVSQIATALHQDVLSLSRETSVQVTRFKADEISLEEVCFWHKSLAGAFFAFVDGLSFVLREAIAENLDSHDMPAKMQRLLDPQSRGEIERVAPAALRYFCRIFSADITIDTSSEDFRGFRALTAAREAFTHPKNHTEVCPFSLFPTLTPAAEWFFLAWRSTLVACVGALGHTLGGGDAPSKQRQFTDAKLKAFAQRRAEYDAHRKPGDLLNDLADVIFPLMRDTPRAIQAMRNTNTATELPATCGLRNLVRVLFSQIEGSALIAARLLHERGEGPPLDKRLLIGDSAAVRTRIADTVDAFSKRFGNGHQVARSGVGWDAFAPARALRNKLTHPHSAHDLIVGSEELDTTLALASWCQTELHHCFDLRRTE